MPQLVYRKALANDIYYLLWLRIQTMSDHLIASGMPLKEEDHLLRVNYLFDQARIITLNGRDIGLLKIDENENSIEIVQVQIDPAFQGKGIGRQVIHGVIEQALSARKKLTLSVLKQNKARELYGRMGFNITGEDDTSFIMELNQP